MSPDVTGNSLIPLTLNVIEKDYMGIKEVYCFLPEMEGANQYGCVRYRSLNGMLKQSTPVEVSPLGVGKEKDSFSQDTAD